MYHTLEILIALVFTERYCVALLYVDALVSCKESD